MAVGKIRKISSWTMLTVVAISLIVFGLFYFGGVDEQWKGKYHTPTYTGVLLIWCYFMLGVCAIGMLLFGVMQFIASFKKNVKGSLITLAVLTTFVIFMIAAYSIGDGTPLTGINASSQMYNVEFWLKTTEMWLYALYIMIGLSSLLIALWGPIRRIIKK